MVGLSSASFYAAFTSKEALFQNVVDRYVSSYGESSSPPERYRFLRVSSCGPMPARGCRCGLSESDLPGNG